ncbi:MAG: glycosyltransferase family 4 protein [Bacteroidota bacterium]|nr:glycosyltransferase family 4 protein [Bacteroidota bacterium]
MRIAVNTRLLLPGKLEGIGWFTHETFSRLTKAHPEHEFIFIFDRKFDQQFIYANNVKGVVLPPPTRHPLLYRVWFDHVLPWYLHRSKADAFIGPDGFLPLKSRIPSLAVIHDLNFEHHPEDLPPSYSKYYRKYFPRFAKHATRIATVSEFSKNDISSTYMIDRSKIDVVYNGVSPKFSPLDLDRKMEARLKFAQSAPYLICVGSLHPRKNIARLLDAFDLLISWNDLPHKLVIVGESFWWDAGMKASWNKLKNKDRVIFTGRLGQDELCNALGGAEALAFVSYFEGFGIPVAEAMRCGVPVVTSNITSLPEIGGDAALYCDPFNTEDIARALNEVIRNTLLRKRMIANGIERSKIFIWQNSADALWKSFERMMGTAPK